VVPVFVFYLLWCQSLCFSQSFLVLWTEWFKSMFKSRVYEKDASKNYLRITATKYILLGFCR
jgi:hypothetical protein